MSNFVYDDIALPDPKADANGGTAPVADPTHRWSANDANRTFQALEDLRTVATDGVVNARQYGVVGNGSVDDTAALQNALNFTQGRTLYLPRGKYIVSSTLFITTRSHHIVGDYGERFADGGTEIAYSGTGPCIQIGTDNGHNWDANEYDGPQDQLFEDFAITHSAPNTTTSSGANFKAGAYGIWDWRSGQIVMNRMWLEKFEANFVGIQSDINRFRYIVSLYSKYGIYIGPRSDQFTLHDLYSFSCDRAVTIDKAGKTRILNAELVGCGTAATSAIEVRQGSSSPFISANWYEHVSTGYNGVDTQSFVSIGEVAGYGAGGSIQSPGGTPTTTSVEGARVADVLTYTTVTGQPYHCKYLVTVGKCHSFELSNPTTLANNSILNHDFLVSVTGSPNSTDTQVAIRGIPSGALAQAITVTGTPGVDVEAWGAAGRVLGKDTTAQHTINGKLTVQSPGSTNPATFFNNSVSGQTAQSVLCQALQNGTYTLGGFGQSIAVQAQVTASKSGGSTLRNVGLQCTAVNGDQNYALETVSGDVQLNTTAGLTFLNKAVVGIGTRAAAPSTGTHQAGEVVFNADPIAGGKVGWVCVTGGSPGTWKAFGAIDP